MDNLTHTLIGVGLSQAGLSKRWGRGTTMILAVSSNLPDLDVVFLLGGPLSFLWRRTMTHSFVGTILLSLLAAWMFKRIYPHFSTQRVLTLTVVGIFGHVFADLWNAYGVVLFWPLSWERVDFSWIFIIDLALWGSLIGALLFGLVLKIYQERVWRLSLLLVAVYVGICSWARQTSAALVQLQGPPIGQTSSIYIYPEPLGPTRFRGVVKGSDSYTVYDVRPFSGEVRYKETILSQDTSDIIDRSRQTDAGKKLDWFFSTAVWRLSTDKQAAIVYGLGFKTEVIKFSSPFVFRVDPDGNVSRI